MDIVDLMIGKSNSVQDCGKPVHNSNPTNLDKWKEKLKLHELRTDTFDPFDPLNDPLFGISPKLRTELVQEAFESLPKPQSTDGIPFEDWKKLYIDDWHKTIEDRNPDIFKIQSEMVAMYSERLISLKGRLKLFKGPIWQRGARGNTIPERALHMLPESLSRAFLKKARLEGNILCHIQGTICVVPESLVRYPRK
jgi:hypothetical protein